MPLRYPKTLSKKVPLLSCLLLFTACARTVPLTIQDNLPQGSSKGYIEFYCSFCLANLAILLAQDNKEVHVANFVTGGTVTSTIQEGLYGRYKMKRLRIAQIPGDYVYNIRLLSPVLEGSTSITFTAKVMQDMLTPIRVEFHRHTSETFKWGVTTGNPLPMNGNPGSLESLTSALSSQDWGTRWYGAEFFGQINVDINKTALTRLTELSGKDEYNNCMDMGLQSSKRDLGEISAECSLVRDQARRILQKIKSNTP